MREIKIAESTSVKLTSCKSHQPRGGAAGSTVQVREEDDLCMIYNHPTVHAAQVQRQITSKTQDRTFHGMIQDCLCKEDTHCRTGIETVWSKV